MKLQGLVFAAVTGILFSPAAFADPPVNVEIADEEAQDFFSSEPDEEDEDSGDKRDRIRKNADAMFEELEANSKGAKIKRAKKQRSSDGDDEGSDDNDNSNINQNVVNVVVVSGDKDTKAEAKNDVKNDVKSEVKSEVEREVEKEIREEFGPPAQKPLPQASTSQGPDSSCYYGVGTWSSWWHRSPGLDDGDILVSFSTGGYSGGLYLGMGLEGMLDDTFGIKLALNGTGFERWDEHRGRHGRGDDDGGFRVNNGDWDFFLGGETVAPRPAHASAVEKAVLHLEDLSLVMHMGDGDGIDIFPSIGLSHFGYHIDAGSQEWTGGSAFLRAGIGMQWVYKRFFAGVELGWYPVELARYGIEDRGDGEKEAVEYHIEDSTDRKRVTFSASFGLSL